MRTITSRTNGSSFDELVDAVVWLRGACSWYPGAGHISRCVRHVLPAHAALLRGQVLPGARASARRLAVQPHHAASRSVHEIRLLQRLSELQDHLLVDLLRRPSRQVSPRTSTV